MDLSEWVSNLLFTCKYGYDLKKEEDMGIIEEEPGLNGEFEEESEYYIRENITSGFQEEKEEDPMKRYDNAMKKIESYYNYSAELSESKNMFSNKPNLKESGFQEEVIENKFVIGKNNSKKKNMLEMDLEVENLE